MTKEMLHHIAHKVPEAMSGETAQCMSQFLTSLVQEFEQVHEQVLLEFEQRCLEQRDWQEYLDEEVPY